jgi:hypothetical protein
MESEAFWRLVGHLKDLLSLAGTLLVIVAFVYGWWFVTKGNCWIGGLFFWPEAVSGSFLQTASGEGVPVTVTIPLTLFNPGWLPMLVEEVGFWLRPPGSSKWIRYDAAALMETKAFTQEPDKSWQAHRVDYIRPFLVKPQTEQAHTVFFIPPVEGQLTDLPPGEYQAFLKITRSGRRKPMGFAMTFSFSREYVAGFSEGNTGVMVSAGSMKVEPAEQPS